MRHWQSVLPLPIHELRYEALVESPEAEARRLIGFLGLDWEPACLEFHRSNRTVQTPSRWQVREPIHRRSEEHTSELQSLMRISYAVFCLKKKTPTKKRKHIRN